MAGLYGQPGSGSGNSGGSWPLKGAVASSQMPIGSASTSRTGRGNAGTSVGGSSGAGSKTTSGKAKGSGVKPTYDPMSDLHGFVDQFDQYTPGSGGSGGNGGAINALVAQIGKNKEAATARYGTQRAQLTDIYGQLRDELRPNADLTAARYNTAIAQSNQGGQAIAQQATSNLAANNAVRQQGLESLGIDPTLAASEEASATNAGLANLAQSNSTWGNLQAVLSNAQQSRDKLDVQGAIDAGILADRSLTTSYEDFMRSLEAQIAEANSQRTGGSGGTAGSWSNPLRDQLNQSIFQQMLAGQGLAESPAGKSAAYTPSAADYAALNKALANSGGSAPGISKTGKPLSPQEIIAIGGPGAGRAYKYSSS
jgi:hypothetical protein